MADKLVAKTQLSYFKGKLDEEFVAKETGKGLSTNDFTNEYKTKLDGIATKLDEIVSQGGEPNKIEVIKVNGTQQEIEPSDKSVDISVPTKVSQLQNDSGFQTSANVESILSSKNYATKSDISSVYKYKGSVETYAELPTEHQQVGDVYNVESADSAHGIKAGDNVAWNGTAWDVLSGTVDLSNYYDKTNYPLCQNADIDEIFA